jgi:hypothetical protein
MMNGAPRSNQALPPFYHRLTSGGLWKVGKLSLARLCPTFPGYEKFALAMLLAALSGVVAFPALVAGASVPAGDPVKTTNADYEVHEWGVLVGCEDGPDYLLTSRPMRVTVVKEPVLYFHSRDQQPFVLKVTFNQGKPTETYPAAVKDDGNAVRWDRVAFSAPVKAAPVVTKGLKLDLDLVPFNEIVNTLNNVDADEVESGGTKAKFLFYEGEMPFTNQVKSVYDPQSREVTVVNQGSYPVFDLFVIVPVTGDLPFEKEFLTAYAPQLRPGETIRLKAERAKEPVDFARPLRDLGFTASESASFAALWENSILNNGRLVYRLPREECDRMITLDFNPQPQKISRALFVLVKE